jgi:peptidoglycan/LPS O-acetylase OafA/YrhL
MLPSPDLNGKKDVYAFNVPAWTLFWEFIVNFVYVVAWRWLKSTRILIGVVAVCAVWLAASALYVGKVDMGPTWTYFWGGMPRVMLGFFGGVLLFRLAGSPRAVKARTSLLALGPALILPIVCLPDVSKEMRAWLDLLIVLLISPLILIWARSFNPPRWLWPTFATLGAMSYAMYILHWPIFEAMKRLAWRYPQLKTEWAPWTGFGILLVVLAVSIVAERYYDRPLRSFINAKLKARGKRRKAEHAAAQVAAE